MDSGMFTIFTTNVSNRRDFFLYYWSIVPLWAYRKSGVGNACAGQFKLKVSELLTELLESLSPMLIFGPTEPTGSANGQLSWYQLFLFHSNSNCQPNATQIERIIFICFGVHETLTYAVVLDKLEMCNWAMSSQTFQSHEYFLCQFRRGV